MKKAIIGGLFAVVVALIYVFGPGIFKPDDNRRAIILSHNSISAIKDYGFDATVDGELSGDKVLVRFYFPSGQTNQQREEYLSPENSTIVDLSNDLRFKMSAKIEQLEENHTRVKIAKLTFSRVKN